MPELPEVEVFKRFADRHALGKAVCTVRVLRPKILSGVTEQALIRAVEGQRFEQTRRHGKHLFIALGSSVPWLYLHFGMTGYLGWWTGGTSLINAYGDPERTDNHIRAQFDFEGGGHLSFHEQRMFGKLGLVENPDAFIERLGLGPDALTVAPEAFLSALQKRGKGQIKPVLMDQSVVAGVGNIYADELLFQCRIHPQRRVESLSETERLALHAEMQAILAKTIQCKADRDRLPPGYLLHVRRKGGRCPRDGAALSVQTIGGRTTYFCPACQIF